MTDLITKQTQIDYEYLVEVAAEICQLIDDGQPMLVIVDDVLRKFTQRIEAPHLQRIAELEKDCDILATNYDAARKRIAQLEHALQTSEALARAVMADHTGAA